MSFALSGFLEVALHVVTLELQFEFLFYTECCNVLIQSWLWMKFDFLIDRFIFEDYLLANGNCNRS